MYSHRAMESAGTETASAREAESQEFARCFCWHVKVDEKYGAMFFLGVGGCAAGYIIRGWKKNGQLYH